MEIEPGNEDKPLETFSRTFQINNMDHRHKFYVQNSRHRLDNNGKIKEIPVKMSQELRMTSNIPGNEFAPSNFSQKKVREWEMGASFVPTYTLSRSVREKMIKKACRVRKDVHHLVGSDVTHSPTVLRLQRISLPTFVGALSRWR